MAFALRPATRADVPMLRVLIERSVRELQAGDYTPRQLDYALRLVYGVDSQLIEDETYFAVEDDVWSPPVIVACGGWSKRKTLFGGDVYAARQDSLLNPKADPAKIRAFFVHPEWVRRGIGSILLTACECAAIADGFTRLEMGATLTGVPFYRQKGYVELEAIDVPLADGEVLPIIRMAKNL
jgi:GNAT superfamily N-acetyltransferase